MPNLKKASKKVTDDWLLAVNKWNEDVDKLHNAQIEFYTYKRNTIEGSSN